MALDPNINRIKFLRSTTAGSIPSVSMIEDGELAINLTDRTIYSKNGPNIVELGFGKGGTVSGAITAPSFNGPLSGNAASATKLQTTRSISLTGSATGTTTFDGSSNASISINVNLVDSAIAYSKTATDLPSTYGVGVQGTFVRSTDGFPMTYAGLLTFKPYSGSNGATLQFLSSYGSAFGNNQVMIRLGDHGTSDWTSWKTLVTSENVGSYAPTLLGVGASGSWNINSASTTRLQTSRTISLSGDATGSASFDGSANISISTVIPKASTTVQGLVKLNNTLTSTSTVEALTAAQGKALSDSTAAAISLANAKWVDETSTHVSGTQYTNTLNYPIKVYAMSTYGGGSDPVQRIDVTNPTGTLSRSWTNEATVPAGYKYTLVNSGGGGWTNLIQVIIVK